MDWTRRRFLRAAGIGVATLGMPASLPAADKRKPNVLFLAVDDLRPQLGCYGHEQMISPNIDRLASEGITFLRSYCQVPVCGASRASLLTGTRPTANRFLGYATWAEKDLPGALSVAEHFRNNGYHTISNGKIFHHRADCRNSWSEAPWHPKGHWRNYQLEENQKLNRRKEKPAGPAYECADVPDNAYFDGQVADKGISDLRRLKREDKPFFLALGFLKPHLPFTLCYCMKLLKPREYPLYVLLLLLHIFQKPPRSCCLEELDISNDNISDNPFLKKPFQ